jgi:hypothetical protein
MRMSKLITGVFAAILTVSCVISQKVVTLADNGGGKIAPQSQTSSTLIADGSDPVPRPWVV